MPATIGRLPNLPPNELQPTLFPAVYQVDRFKSPIIPLIATSLNVIQSDDRYWCKCLHDQQTDTLVAFRDRAVVFVRDWSEGQGVQATWIGFTSRLKVDTKTNIPYHKRGRQPSMSYMCVCDGQALFAFKEGRGPLV